MKKTNLIYAFCLICILLVSCSSNESSYKDAVKNFCEAYQSQQSDMISALYPEFTEGEIKAEQIDLANLKVENVDGKWAVEDGKGHIFYVGEKDDKFVILDSKNVIEWKSEIGGDIKAAQILGMVDDESTDIQRIKAYTQLKDNSDLINFLKQAHPEACVYGIKVDNVKATKNGEMGIYWLEVKATLKSGALKPLGPVTVNFIGKDKNGDVIFKDNTIASLSDDDVDVVEQVIDLSDYPNVVDVDVKLSSFGNKEQVSDIDLLCAYSKLTPQDYQAYVNSKK